MDSPQIFTKAGKLPPKGFFVLCSDGVYSVVPNKEIEKIPIKTPCEDIATHLLKTALDRDTQDNASVVVVGV